MRLPIPIPIPLQMMKLGWMLKDIFSIHFICFMNDEEFPKPILMDLLRVEIAMRYVNTEETNFEIVNEHIPIVNLNNEIMAGVEEAIREHIDDNNINACMDLVEEGLLQLNNGGIDNDLYIDFNDDNNYYWITKMQNKMKESIDDCCKMITIQYEKYNPTNIKSKSQKMIIFNHIYQHYIFHNINSNDQIPPSMNVKNQDLYGTGNKMHCKYNSKH